MRPFRFGRRAVGSLVAATLCALALPPAARVHGSAQQHLEYQVKAAFLYNFVSFIEWPASAFAQPGDPFRVCIIGFDPFGAELDGMQREQVGGRRIVVERLKHEEASARCRVLFLSATDDARLRTVRRAAAGRGVLIVTETRRSLDNCAGIALIVDDGRVRFDVNTAALRSERLVASSKLLRVAREVVDRPARCGVPIPR